MNANETSGKRKPDHCKISLREEMISSFYLIGFISTVPLPDVTQPYRQTKATSVGIERK